MAIGLGIDKHVTLMMPAQVQGILAFADRPKSQMSPVYSACSKLHAAHGCLQ